MEQETSSRTEHQPIIQAPRSTINKSDLKSFCKVKDVIDRTKCQLTQWEKIFIKFISDSGLISKIDKELKKKPRLQQAKQPS